MAIFRKRNCLSLPLYHSVVPPASYFELRSCRAIPTHATALGLFQHRAGIVRLKGAAGKRFK